VKVTAVSNYRDERRVGASEITFIHVDVAIIGGWNVSTYRPAGRVSSKFPKLINSNSAFLWGVHFNRIGMKRRFWPFDDSHNTQFPLYKTTKPKVMRMWASDCSVSTMHNLYLSSAFLSRSQIYNLPRDLDTFLQFLEISLVIRRRSRSSILNEHVSIEDVFIYLLYYIAK